MLGLEILLNNTLNLLNCQGEEVTPFHMGRELVNLEMFLILFR